MLLLGVGQGASALVRATVFADVYGVERVGALDGPASRPITAAPPTLAISAAG